MIHFVMRKAASRRQFFRTAPLAATATLVLPLEAAKTEIHPATPDPFHYVPASEFAESTTLLTRKSGGNFNFFDNTTLPVTAVMTYEEKKAAREFEWHEGRDHLLQVIEGSCVYQLGGTPQDGRNTRPGEWLAPTSDGATTLTLHKGDWLIITRGTPHKRITEKSVTFFLISTTGAVIA